MCSASRLAESGARRPRRRAGEAQALAAGVLDARVVLVDRMVGVADRRPDGPAVRLHLLQDHRVLVVGDGQEAAELRLGIVDQHREQQLALVVGDDRLVVGDELGEQAEHEQREEDPQAPVAAPVGLEVAPAPLVERGEREAREIAAHGQRGAADLLGRRGRDPGLGGIERACDRLGGCSGGRRRVDRIARSRDGRLGGFVSDIHARQTSRDSKSMRGSTMRIDEV